MIIAHKTYVVVGFAPLNLRALEKEEFIVKFALGV
tara:strand:+ start:317 stop:421 length:105 start_codon:yes stop_codon:yes gene_type:complete